MNDNGMVTIRIPIELRDRMNNIKYGPYRIGNTQLLLRGLALALKELDGIEIEKGEPDGNS